MGKHIREKRKFIQFNAIVIVTCVMVLLSGATYAYGDSKSDTLATNDPLLKNQWGLSNTKYAFDIGFNEAVSIINANQGALNETIVAVIDTGFDYFHKDLISNVWTNKGEIAGNGKDDDGNGYVDDVHGYDFYNDKPLTVNTTSKAYEHGTHCAGTIAASSNNGIGISGVASVGNNVRVMDLKVLGGKDGDGPTEDLIRAIKYAEKNGASICNISMGSYQGDHDLEIAMKNSNMLFVCAAGNDGFNTDYSPIFPGSFNLPNVICVANMTSRGYLLGMSNYGGKTVSIAAPGTDILSTVPGNKYDYMDGTSMAAPFVTGAAALMRSYYTGITAADIKQIIIDSSTANSALSGKVSCGGYLNLAACLKAAKIDAFIGNTLFPDIIAVPESIPNSYKEKLVIKIGNTDLSNCTVKYSRGSHNKSYFESGKGIKLNLNSKGVSTRTIAVPKVYTIYAVDSTGHSSIKRIQCTSDAISWFKLNYSAKRLKSKESFKLKPVFPKKGRYGRVVSYSSSDRSVATVSKNGTVIAKKKGITFITAKTGNSLTYKCKITVY